MGPSTGLPTRTCQGDIAKAYNLSHGDCKHVLLIPGNLQEAFEFGIEVLNLAERLQTLVFLMLDLDMGMNNYMVDPLKLDSKPLDRGKILDAEALEKVQEFARYRDVDGDGIPYRTVPGTPHPKAAFFTRGTGHTDRATYSEKAEDWQSNMDRLIRKFDTARNITPQPIVETTDGATVGIIAYGSSHAPVQEGRARLQQEHGLATDYLRIRALPVSDAVRQFIASHDRIILIEQNRDAQMASILKAEYADLAPRIASLLHYNGLPLDAQTVVNGIVHNA
jgi:2-oxoglutarate ferredoxin oxidoreductase subunit alpha